MKRIPAKCKFCGATLSLQIDEDCPPLQLEKWVSWAACNRCADYRMAIITARDRARRACQAWSNARLLGPASEQQVKPRIEMAIRMATQTLCLRVCQHWRCVNNWKPEIIEILMDRPDLSDRIVMDYVRRTERLASQPRPTPELRPTAPDP